MFALLLSFLVTTSRLFVVHDNIWGVLNNSCDRNKRILSFTDIGQTALLHARKALERLIAFGKLSPCKSGNFSCIKKIQVPISQQQHNLSAILNYWINNTFNQKKKTFFLFLVCDLSVGCFVHVNFMDIKLFFPENKQAFFLLNKNYKNINHFECNGILISLVWIYINYVFLAKYLPQQSHIINYNTDAFALFSFHVLILTTKFSSFFYSWKPQERISLGFNARIETWVMLFNFWNYLWNI